MRRTPPPAAAGIVGPAAFVAAWAVAGARADGYSPVDDAISRLAVPGAATRPLMTAGFVTFGLAMPVYGRALARAGFGRAGAAAVVTGLSTLGAAAFPLGRTGTLHGVFAVAGYASLAAVPGLAAPVLARRGHRAAAGASAAVAAASALCLAGTAVLDGVNGLLQRVGLGVADAWVVAAAACLLARGGGRDAPRRRPDVPS